MRPHDRAVADLIRNDALRPRTVILSAAWSAYCYGSAYFRGVPSQKTGHNDARAPSAAISRSMTENAAPRSKILAAIGETAGFLIDRFDKVIIVGPMPFLTNDLRGGLPTVIRGIEGVQTGDFLRQTSELLGFFLAPGFPDNVQVLLPHMALCNGTKGGHCLAERDGLYLYSDIAHVSDYGAREIFLPLFEKYLSDSGTAVRR